MTYTTATSPEVSYTHLVPGDVVQYHGSLTDFHGTFTVTLDAPVAAVHFAAWAQEVDPRTIPQAYRYSIENGEGVRLDNVRRESLTVLER